MRRSFKERGKRLFTKFSGENSDNTSNSSSLVNSECELILIGLLQNGLIPLWQKVYKNVCVRSRRAARRAHMCVFRHTFYFDPKRGQTNL